LDSAFLHINVSFLSLFNITICLSILTLFLVQKIIEHSQSKDKFPRASLRRIYEAQNFEDQDKFPRASNVVQLRKTWSCISMMVPTLMLHPSSVEVLVVSVINGASVDADLPSICYTFVSDLQVHDVRLIQMLNYVIMRYTLIFALIY
jgi:hypothetical protein